MYPLADDITIDASLLGVRVRTVDGSRTCLLTTRQAEELADQLAEWTWAGVLCGGGAVLTARACESCVVVRCSGHASAEELDRFAAELKATAAQARRYVPPEAGWTRKRKPQAQGGEMTDEELRKLALEYHRLTDGGTCRLMATPVNHAGQLARRLLELMPPADDGEPLTVGWLKGVNGNGWGYVGHTIAVGELEFEPHAHNAGGPVTLHPEKLHVKRLTTRGDVRHLCAALGITLQEPKS